MDNDFSKEKAIYDQNCQWYRYQDGLMWGRFQTAATIEAAMLYGIYQVKLPLLEKKALVLFGSVLILIVSLIALVDGYYASGHLDQIKKFEGYSLARPKYLPSGGILLRAAIGLVTILNMALIVRVFLGN